MVELYGRGCGVVSHTSAQISRLMCRRNLSERVPGALQTNNRGELLVSPSVSHRELMIPRL